HHHCDHQPEHIDRQAAFAASILLARIQPTRRGRNADRGPHGHQMTRRLTRDLADAPPHSRWSDPPPLRPLHSPDQRGKVLELLAAQPWRAWKGVELTAIL